MQTEKILVQAPRGIPPKMVTDYVKRCLAALPATRAALDRSDYVHMRIFGHRLRGSGGAYGMLALTEIGSAIEKAALEADTTELRLQVAALEACLNRMEILSD
ncbi:MAG TPA: Hpt domain-containing protein [Bryobacteraceae bacterium]|nr:Hpt domain-containing protein [Bryobacteraceae bacterium]